MNTKILVVDDEADLQLLIRQKFRSEIRGNIYEFIFAGNGQEALDILREHPDTRMVLSDINMPVMDGLTLLTKLPELAPMLKTVIVSAYSDLDNIRMAMNRGAFDFICKPIDFTDLAITIEKTIAHVAQMHETMRAIQENNILKMYVDETVINFMARPEFGNSLLVSETIEATVAFFDICGFTAIAEVMPANAVVGLLNRYFDDIVIEIIAHGGYVDKFMGDAVMAVFRGERHLDRAIDAALAIREKIRTNQIALHDCPDYYPNVSVGINSGEMVSGNIGSASLRRLDYTVIGDAVNLAQRLQSAAQPGQIIIGEHTRQMVRASFRCEWVGEVKLKNKAAPVGIYEILE